MAIVSSTQVTVATTPTLLVRADSDGCRVVIHKVKAHQIYLGGSDVTTSNGFLFDHDGTVDIDLKANGELYACCATATETAYILIVGNR